jgi:hypothetical protein
MLGFLEYEYEYEDENNNLFFLLAAAHPSGLFKLN